MWIYELILGKDAALAPRLIGAFAFGILIVGIFNVFTTGVPTLPLLIYRGAMLVGGLGLLYLAGYLNQHLR